MPDTPPDPTGGPPDPFNPTEPPPGDPPPDPPAEGRKAGSKDDLADQLRSAETRYASERRARNKAEQRLAEMTAAGQTEVERAVTKARDEGRAEALKNAGMRLAAAEFRAAAAGKLTDPGAAIEYLDLAKFVDDEGEPDTTAILTAVERLVAASGAGEPKRKVAPAVPNGVRPEADESDWLRGVIAGGP